MVNIRRSAFLAIASSLLVTPAAAEEKQSKNIRKAVERAPTAYMLGDYLAGGPKVVGPTEVSIWVSPRKSSAFRNAVNGEIAQAACSTTALREMLKHGATLRFDVRFSEQTLPFTLAEAGCQPSAFVPRIAAGSTPAEVLVSVIKPNLPIELRSGAGIFEAVAEGKIVRFVLRKANGASAANEIGSAADELCQAEGAAKFFASGGLFALEVDMRSGSKKRYGINANSCASGQNFKAIEIPMPLPTLASLAIVEFGSDKPSISFSSCNEWRSQINSGQTNEDWLMKYYLEPIKKNEFETTIAFEARQKAASLRYANISFKIHPDELSYDADTRIMHVGPMRNRRTLAADELGRDTYIGTNAFGVSAEVVRIRSVKLTVDFENSTAILPSRVDIPMAPEIAEALESTGSVYVLGEIVKTASGGGRGVPTVSSPIETFTSENIVTINPVCIATMLGEKEVTWEEPLR